MLAVYANGYNANLDQALTQWHLGSAIIFPNYNGGPLMPATIAGMQQLTHDLQAHADTPLLLATDEEGGSVDRLSFYYGATPSPQQLAATGDPQQAYAQAQTDAQRMRTLGLNVDFAPLADVSQGNGIDPSRTFGTTAGQVTTYAGPFLDGLQQNGVAGTLKHWPGLGAVTSDPHFGLPTINRSLSDLKKIDLDPYQIMIPKNNPAMIMVTDVVMPAIDSSLPAELSPKAVNGILRGYLGYNGVVITDGLYMHGISERWSLSQAAVLAIIAGNDLIEGPYTVSQVAAVVTALKQALQSGKLTEARIDQSVARILLMKVEYGIVK